MNGIFKRTKQFFRALTANISPDDEKYISLHLNPEEQKLFFAMSVIDQSHCLNTAYTIERLAIQDGADICKNFLIRCALLHDCGRVKGDLNIFGKVFAVLITHFLPKLADGLELHGNKMIHVYRHHAEIGAQKLLEIGLLKESKIVAAHHLTPKNTDPPELKLLRIADEEN